MERHEVMAVDTLIAKSGNEHYACTMHGVSIATYRRWKERYDLAGLDAPAALPRSGRPRTCHINADEGAYLARLYLRSNLRRGAGSMAMVARMAAADPDSPLADSTRAAIQRLRHKCALPTAIKEAMRLGSRATARYRDPKDGLTNGIYTPGWLRMADDGTRRLMPGEKQVWDDASVNVAVVVPWERGGDKCSDRFGVRLARFQLLLGIDCATDFCPGFGYVMRANDAYNTFDVRSTLFRVWSLAGYAPDQCVMEGGSWQAEGTKAFLRASDVDLVSAKGRPNQKLVEGYFNRLWTVMSILLPNGNVGRFRGEMVAENADWIACREGRRDPRGIFPGVEELLNALNKGIAHLNSERIQSRAYGEWVPRELYAARLAAEPGCAGHTLPGGLRRFALPIRKNTTVRRSGMIEISAECPFGWNYPYAFAWPDGWRYEGARVTVSFDPADIHAGAVVELAERFQERGVGTVIADQVECISAAPALWQAADGMWQARTLDNRDAARGIKRGTRSLIGAQVAAFDERGARIRVAAAPGATEGFALGGATPTATEPDFALYEPADLEAETRSLRLA